IWRERHSNHGDVTVVQMDSDAIEVVHPPGARKARCVGGPGRMRTGGVRIEHRVINHQLTTSSEHFVQRYMSTFTLEAIVLLHELPGKLSALATQLVAKVRELLFFRQVLLASCHPFVV